MHTGVPVGDPANVLTVHVTFVNRFTFRKILKCA